MNARRFDYGRMIAEALRDVARQALAYVAEEGLPGEHHFYVSFHTRGEGVHVPPFLREQYPDETTIVLQNQFWDLVVDDEGFSVTLAFGGSRDRIMVPWPELTAFADPTAQLGLRFVPEAGEEDEGDGGDGDDTLAWGGPGAGSGGAAGDGAAGGEDADATGNGAGAKVVSLDRFRRKDDDRAGD